MLINKFLLLSIVTLFAIPAAFANPPSRTSVPRVRPSEASKCEEALQTAPVPAAIVLVKMSVQAAIQHLESEVVEYRRLGGQVYWQVRKLQTTYAEHVDQENLKYLRWKLTLAGQNLRVSLSLNGGHLGDSLRLGIQEALEDYQHLEAATPAEEN